MNNVTYLENFKEAYPREQKLAKISKDKLARLKISRKKYAVKPSNPTVETTPVVNEPINMQAPVTSTPVVETVVKDNYSETAETFQMTTYKKSFDELPLVAARKIRITFKLPKHIAGMRKKLATEKLAGMPHVIEETPIQEEIPAVNVEMPKTVAEPLVKEQAPSVSVDDYLQKEMPHQGEEKIIQLNDDITQIKQQVAKYKDILGKLTAEYDNIQNQQKLQALEEEKIGMTQVLNDIIRKVKEQEAKNIEAKQALGRK